jgi:hypothetical protein
VGAVTENAMPTADRRSQRLRLRRATPLLASVVIHLGFWLALLGSASGDLVSGQTASNDGPAMTVSLVALVRPSTAPAAATSASLKVLTAKQRTDVDAIVAAPVKGQSSALDQLAERLQQQTPLTPGPPTPPQKPIRPSVPAPPEATAARETLSKTGPPSSGPASGGAATGGLWGQIEPCWRNLGSRVSVPVSLQVVLDARGRLAKAPTILRGGSALDERRLTAEATALQALGACLPQADLRFGGKTYQLDFPPG